MKTNDIPKAHPSLLDALHRQDAKANEMRPSEGFTEKVMEKVKSERVNFRSSESNQVRLNRRVVTKVSKAKSEKYKLPEPVGKPSVVESNSYFSLFTLSLFISNNGSPIPASDSDSIFVPFFTTKHGGTGIGLALSRQIMVRQGGDLELMEQPENGYTVTFRLTI